jgi:hypothetical protein
VAGISPAASANAGLVIHRNPANPADTAAADLKKSRRCICIGQPSTSVLPRPVKHTAVA